MGQQQLLLLVLVMVLVIIALVPVNNIFLSNAQQANRDALIADMINLASKAQRYHRIPATLGGGEKSFSGFYISPIDTGNNNGSYSLTTSVPSGITFTPGSITPLATDVSTFYIVASGIEEGNNPSAPVKCYLTVTANNTSAIILN